MKSLLFTSLLAAATASPAELHPRQAKGAGGGFLGSLVSGMNSGYGKVPDIPGAAPRTSFLPNRVPGVPSAKTIKVRYGPYKVPNMSKKSVSGEMGTLFNYPDLGVARPCEGDCVLLGISAGLEYANGSDANTANGMWLHHMVAFTVGPKRFDPTCAGKMSLPHMLIGSDATKSERFFSSGNERSAAAFNPPWVKNEVLGYYLYPTDKFSFIVDLMNQNMDDRTVYMTLTYDYVTGRPKDVGDVKAIWLDAAQCGTSEIAPPKQTGNFSVKYTWTANLDGDILGAGGHLHDGGTHLTLSVDGKQVCDSVATYGGAGAGGMGGPSPMAGMGGEGPGHGHADVKGNVKHITSMSACFDDTLGVKTLKKGQKWGLEAFYDYDKYAGMTHESGKQSNVMGISIMYVKNPKV